MLNPCFTRVLKELPLNEQKALKKEIASFGGDKAAKKEFARNLLDKKINEFGIEERSITAAIKKYYKQIPKEEVKPKPAIEEKKIIEPEEKPKKIEGYSSHGQITNAKEILKLETERGNYIDPEFKRLAETGEYDAIWLTEKPEDAIRYLREADKADIAKYPPTKEEIAELSKFDTKDFIEMDMKDGDGGNLYLIKKKPAKKVQKKVEFGGMGEKPVPKPKPLIEKPKEAKPIPEPTKPEKVPSAKPTEAREVFEKPSEPSKPVVKKDISEASEIFKGKVSDPFILEAKDVNVDTKRFQPREGEVGTATVEGIKEALDPAKLQAHPLVVWKDPVDGKYYILEGHSRNKGLAELNIKDRKVLEFKGTEEEAIKFAEESNLATPHTFIEDVRIFKRMRDKDKKTKKQLKAQWGDRYNKLEAYTHLDPNGKFMEIVSQEAKDSFPYIEQKARMVGQIRKEFPELTNTHEKQMFDALYPTDRTTTRYMNMTADEFRNIVKKQVINPQWTKNRPLKFGKETIEGLLARPDTRSTMTEINANKEMINKLKKNLDKKGAAETIKSLQKRNKELWDSIEKEADNQMGLELGAFGTPGDFVRLGETVFEGIKGASEVVNRALQASKIPREVKNVQEHLIWHKRMENKGEFTEWILGKRFKEAIPDESRWPIIRDALQIPGDKANMAKLTPFERGILEWLKIENKKIQDFKLKNELVTKRSFPEGVEYVMGHYINRKTGKPQNWDWNKFTKQLPQAREKKYETFREAEKAGYKPVTNNVGAILGEDFKLSLRAHATRELAKQLRKEPTPYEDLMITTKDGKTRRAMMLEKWENIEGTLLEDVYKKAPMGTRGWPSFLNPWRARKHPETGKTILFEEPIAVHKDVYQPMDNFFRSPEYGKLDRLIQITKATKLMGLFHSATVMVVDAFMGRNPIKDIYKGHKLTKYPDEIVEILYEHGRKLKGREELGYNPMEVLKVYNPAWYGKGANALLWPARFMTNLTFNHVVNKIQLAMSYAEYQKLRPEYELLGKTKHEAARAAVKATDRLFSHEDIRYAMNEANKFMQKFYYSVTARKWLTRGFFSIQWQKQHISAFIQAIKSSVPGTKAWKDPQGRIYRRYAAALATSYIAMDLWNYLMTKKMDGKGIHIWENEELDPGKNWFYVRAPFNHPDDSRAWIHPFKTFTEVPEMIAGLAKGIYMGVTDKPIRENPLSKFIGKMNPFMKEFASHFLLDVDEFGNKLYQDVNGSFVRRTGDFLLGTFAPISFSQVVQTAEYHKAPIGAALSAIGFPVSKGYPSGIWNWRLGQFQLTQSLNKKEVRDKAIDLFIQGMNGKDGAISQSIYILGANLNMKQQAISNFIMQRHMPLIRNWENTHSVDKAAFMMSLTVEDRSKFLDALIKDGQLINP